MKKFAFFAALAAVAVVGCNKQEKDLPVDAGRTIVVKVTAENNLSRGDYNEAGSFIWSATDRIGVNMYDVEGGHDYGTWSAPLDLTAGEGTPNGTFTFDGQLPSYVHYGTAAFYPYDGTNQPASNVGGNGNMYFYLPASIDYVEGMNRMMLVGAIEQDATDIKLYQAGAGIRISLKDVPARATKVSLTVEGKSIANIWPTIAPGDAGTAAASAPTDGVSTVTYNIATASDVRDMVFTYAVPVQDYANARLTVTVAEGNNTIWTKSGKVNTSPGRGQILAMPELTVKDPANIFYLSYRDENGTHHNKVLKFADGTGTAADPFTVTGSIPEVGYAYIEREDGVTYNFPNYVEGNTGVAYIEYGGNHPNEVMYIAPYDINEYSLVINDANSVTLSYEVFFKEKLDENYFIYDGDRYSIKKLSNDLWIMTQSMRFIPKGMTVSSDATDGNGLWYPYTSDGTNVTVNTDAVSIEARGLLYDHQVAFGAEITADNFKSFEGTQGICPPGWHIPTRAEFLSIVGYSNKMDNEDGAATDKDAVYYDNQYNGGRIKAMNEDGFNWDFAGSINRSNNTGTGQYQKVITKNTSCSVDAWIGKNAVTYYMGSTGKTPSDPTTNRQFMSLMSTFTSSYSEGKASIAYSNYLGGYALRCIRNAE